MDNKFLTFGLIAYNGIKYALYLYVIEWQELLVAGQISSERGFVVALANILSETKGTPDRSLSRMAGGYELAQLSEQQKAPDTNR